jgi:hypothetical protein
LDFLRSEINDRKQKLASLEDNELSSFRQGLTKIREGAETLIIQPSFAPRLRSMSALIWISIIPLLILIYATSVAIWQRDHQKEIHEIATMTASAMPTATATLAATPVVTFTPGP